MQRRVGSNAAWSSPVPLIRLSVSIILLVMLLALLASKGDMGAQEGLYSDYEGV